CKSVDAERVDQRDQVVDDVWMRRSGVVPAGLGEAMPESIGGDHEEVPPQGIDIAEPGIARQPSPVNEDQGVARAFVKVPRPHAVDLNHFDDHQPPPRGARPMGTAPRRLLDVDVTPRQLTRIRQVAFQYPASGISEELTIPLRCRSGWDAHYGLMTVGG